MSMIRRRRRCLPIKSDDNSSSEDDSSNKRKLGSSSTSTAQVISITNNRKKGGRLPIATSEEDDEEESSGRVTEFIHVNHRFNNYNTDSSSDEERRLVIDLIERKSNSTILKRVDNSLVVSSESDADDPIRFIRKNKRMRLCSSSSESSLEDEHSEEHNRTVRFDNNARLDNHDRPNTSQNSDFSITVGNRVRASQRKWRTTKSDDSESEFTSDDDIKPRILRPHSKTVFYSDSSSNDSEEEVPIRKPSKRKAVRTIIYSDDDSVSHKNSYEAIDADVCPICLNDFNLQQVGKPSTCDHSFCLDCIEEWAKNSNTCPVDRKPFVSILVQSFINGATIQEIPVFNVQEANARIAGWEAEEVQIRVIGSYSYDSSDISDDEDRIDGVCFSCMRNTNASMISCNICYCSYHLQCVDPPLRRVPAGPWICEQCINS